MDTSLCHQIIHSHKSEFYLFEKTAIFDRSLTMNKLIVIAAQILIIPWGLFTLHCAGYLVSVCSVEDEDCAVFLGVANIFAALLGAVLYSLRNENYTGTNKTNEPNRSPMESEDENLLTPISLSNVKLAKPCSAEWRWMSGNDRVRFCRLCSLHVYNFSAMTEKEIEDLILKTEGRLCVRYYQRKDGTILTRDCPEGLRALKAKWASARKHLIAATMSLFGYLGFMWWTKSESFTTAEAEVKGAFVESEIIGKLAPRDLLNTDFSVKKNEKFIRERARFKVIPVAHFINGSRAQGDAVVKVQISPTGEVIEATFINGNPIFKDVAEEAARRWAFEPMIHYGYSSKVESKLTFHFSR